MSFLAQPLDALLKRPGAVRILRALLRHGGQLSAPRLAAQAELTLPGVQKVLDHLEGLGVVRVTGEGRVRLYHALSDHPLIAMLTDLFRAEAGYRAAVLAAAAAAARPEHPVALWLFGSAARREDQPESDLDLMLIAPGNEAERGRRADAVRERLAENPILQGLRPSVVVMSPDEVAAMAVACDPLWQSILNEAQVLLGKTPRCLASARGAAA